MAAVDVLRGHTRVADADDGVLLRRRQRDVRRLRPHTNGEYFLTLDDGQEIKLSRSYRDRVDQLLQRR